ncbi:ribonuclease HIII [Gracilibacillus halophilus YIM-C55.5]|uniref:Ribonuclease HIII n=1 Tax=Gracilibacillus halophilus YIM-C55.5 TaxID=1308866 RepID=N4WCU1_9BACI|nr:ribonuclease HIII [Gracilibacillus halophilus]ENH97039.1 ribonuclease HIII [Gracilibacillus halophilus YIM-C55.5]
MSNIVLTFPKTKLHELETYYRDDVKGKPAHSIFQAKKDGVTITAYQSGKVMFQGNGAEQEASIWQSSHSSVKAHSSKEKKTVNDHAYQPDKRLFQMSHIGTDEAGTGDYFGPITVASAYVSEENLSILQSLGITDSKQLTDENILALSKEIVQHNIPYSLLTLPNQKYNQMQQKGWNQGKMKAMLHHHAIQKLLAKLDVETPPSILIDQFCPPATYSKYLRQEGQKMQQNMYFMTKAESYSTSVAVASIIARAKFVKDMDQLTKSIGVEIPKGASQRVDEMGAYIVKKFGKERLQHIAKTHFANTKKLETYLRQ